MKLCDLEMPNRELMERGEAAVWPTLGAVGSCRDRPRGGLLTNFYQRAAHRSDKEAVQRNPELSEMTPDP